MILSFKTKIEDRPTYFVEKIWCGLIDSNIEAGEYKKYNEKYITKDLVHEPKLHTIRQDKKNRWKPGMMIDFFINARQKDMFRFAPQIPVVSTQDISIIFWGTSVQVFIDGEWFGDAFFDQFKNIECNNFDLDTLAKNDGFDSLEEFFNYFNEDFKGKIIHWTDLKYT